MRKSSAVLALAAALLLTALTGAAVLAQEPTPTASASPTAAPGCPVAVFEGPSTRTINRVQFDVPAGSYAQSIPPPGSTDGAFTVCHVQTGASITISSITCVEIGRSAPTDAGVPVLNQIIASCRVLPPTPTSQVPPFSCPSLSNEEESVVDAPGGQPHLIAGAIQVTLPEGKFVVRVLGSAAAICASNYSLVLSLADCRRADIRPPDGVPGLALADAIVASCVVINPVPEPTQPPFAPAGNIRPPSTGDGGLAGH